MGEYGKKLGILVRDHRKKSGLTQHELADLASVGKTSVFDIEKGKLSVRLDTLLKVLEVLNIKIAFQSKLMNLIKKARVYVNGIEAGVLEENEKGKKYRFIYLDGYKGPSVSLVMPLDQRIYEYKRFPPFFEGLLPEGVLLDGLCHYKKIDRNDLMSQLISVGHDMVGFVTVEEFK